MKRPQLVNSVLVLMSVLIMGGQLGFAQEPAGDSVAQKSDSKIVTFTTQEDHRNMQQQLGITKLRPGPSGNPAEPDAANTDEANANPYPDLPDVMKRDSGELVTTPEMWRNHRRPEIVEAFEREVLGRIPNHVPGVTWELVATEEKTLGETIVIQKQLNGKVDNSTCPEIEVNISMVVVTPKTATEKVPMLMMFGFTGFEPWAGQFRGRGFGPRPGSEPPATQQLVERGWGYATISPGTIQADNGAGLTRGIVGLTNQGQPRKPDDWGSLRAWAWGASRGLDYLQTDPAVDATKVGIEGVSRYGKAALVTMAFDERLAMVLVGSSGEGGASLYRRNFGEAVENLTGSGEYHWMAGNFLKYGTAESSFGAKNASDLPVDSHQLIALCAPRPTFISYGVPEKGDAKWLDQQGSFMATIGAQPAFRLLGARDLGRSDDYKTEKMPAVNVDMLNGELAWRQHDGGHTDLPNIKHFVKWADKLFGRVEGATQSTPDSPESGPAKHQAIERKDPNSITAHQQLLTKTKQGQIDVYFEGDSITRRWGATDYPQLLANWNQNFRGWNAANFGWGGDTTQNILWRLQNGEIDGVSPKIIVLLAGTNNIGNQPGDESKVDEVVGGITSIIELFHQRVPSATIVLTAIFPRNDNMAVMPTINKINERIAGLADGKQVRFLNINDQLADSSGTLLPGMSGDKLHLAEQGYQVWANGLKPIFTEVLGPPAAVDNAPPPTGDPSAARATK